MDKKVISLAVINAKYTSYNLKAPCIFTHWVQSGHMNDLWKDQRHLVILEKMYSYTTSLHSSFSIYMKYIFSDNHDQVV